MSALAFAVGVVAIAAALSLVMSFAWIIERRTGNSGWIDTVWTFGLGAVGAASALVPLAGDTAANLPRRILVAAAIAVWALRLGAHIASRTAGITDDPRYAALRQGFGKSAAVQMWLLVQKQALVSIPLGVAIFLAAHNPASALRLAVTGQHRVVARLIDLKMAGVWLAVTAQDLGRVAGRSATWFLRLAVAAVLVHSRHLLLLATPASARMTTPFVHQSS